MFRRLILSSLFLCGWTSIGATEQPCCGPVTPAGNRLSAVLDGMNVESLWLAHEHVNWETGAPDRDGEYEPGQSTHCSAFAAAAAKKLGVYMLRPPEHGQSLLASAQARWFRSQEGRDQGWRGARDAKKAQILANQGALVVVVYESPDDHKPGHIAIVRPSTKSSGELAEEGPEVIQAGQHNHNSTSVKNGFRSHPGAWPDGVLYYMHP